MPLSWAGLQVSHHSCTPLVPARTRVLGYPVLSLLPRDLWEGHLQLIRTKFLFEEDLFPHKAGSAKAEALKGLQG